MIEHSIQRLIYLTDTIPAILNNIGDEELTLKTSPEKWSKKQIIGHLIDSATNNHQRFVRGQFEDSPEIKYDQDKWNQHGFYQSINNQQLISFWTLYNKQLLEIMVHMPKESLSREIKIGEDNYTLASIINGYVEHLEHHLKQIVDYN